MDRSPTSSSAPAPDCTATGGTRPVASTGPDHPLAGLAVDRGRQTAHPAEHGRRARAPAKPSSRRSSSAAPGRSRHSSPESPIVRQIITSGERIFRHHSGGVRPHRGPRRAKAVPASTRGRPGRQRDRQSRAEDPRAHRIARPRDRDPHLPGASSRAWGLHCRRMPTGRHETLARGPRRCRCHFRASSPRPGAGRGR